MTTHPLYSIKMEHDGHKRSVLSLTGELPADVPNVTLTGQQIGNLTTYLSAREVGHVEVPDRFTSTVGNDGRLELSAGGQTWVYAVSDLTRELGATTAGGGNRPVVIRIPARNA
ncbi:MAG: hypothetical protein M3Q12_01180 [Pseudomonadota bacterium]|nr:hypothetical protein [Pseudomonadota bacterium]